MKNKLLNKIKTKIHKTKAPFIDKIELDSFTVNDIDKLQDIYENSEKRNLKKLLLDNIKNRFSILSAFIFVFAIIIFINTTILQLSPSSEIGAGQSDLGISRERTVEAPRGNIVDRYGIPLAISKNINILYICNANMENDKYNEMLLDLTKFLESNNVSYTNLLSDYISISPLKFNKTLNEIIAWQTNKNIFNLQKKLDNSSVSYDDKKYAKTDTSSLFDYLRYTLYKIDKKYSIEDSYRIMRIRYAVYLDNWAYKNGKPIIIAKDVDDSIISKLEEQNYRFMGILSGIESERRYLPDAKYLGHVIGYMGAISSKQYDELQGYGYTMNDIVGKSGVEAYAERYLKGVNGVSPYNILTTKGEEEIYFPENIGKPAIAGNDIMLTIDLNLQKVAMESLKKNIEFIKNNPKDKNKGDADSGAVVMLDVRNGETLVMASYPSFDPKDFMMAQYDEESKKRMVANLLDTKDKPMLNRAIMEIYAPGSTFKPITAISALEEGISTNIRCGGTEIIGEWPFRCLEHPTNGHGNLTLERGLATSCNIYFHKMGVMTGIDKLSKWMKTFGLGEYTGIDLPGEEKGYRSSREVKKLLRQNPSDQIWFPADTAQTAIGQFDNRYTIIQLARYVSAVSNGILTTPHVIKEITKSNGEVLRTGSYENVNLPVKKSTIESLKGAMIAVSQDREGTARSAFKNYEIEIACKTGTAETGNEDRSSSNALFICYAPADNPKVAIAQIIEKGVWGSNTMGIAKDLLNAYFNLDVPVSYETIVIPGVS